jgi:mycothiol synthase
MHPRVSPARPHELRPALARVFRRRSEVERDRLVDRGLALFAPNGQDAAVLFVTRDASERVCGAALAQALPGALGVAWPPSADTPEAEGALAVAVREWFRGRGVKVCQAFARLEERPDVAPLERAGFRYTTQVALLQRETTYARDRLPPTDRVDGKFYHPAFREPFVTTLLATHEGTLDCPELNGTRTPEELAAGFEFPAQASRWHFLAERTGRPAGVVLLEPDAENRSLELAYLGVVPGARGTGLGDRLVRWVLSEAAQLEWAVTLSVDVRNIPALRLYHRHGFVETERRDVFLA